jgi:hypothetical protein
MYLGNGKEIEVRHSPTFGAMVQPAGFEEHEP